MDRFIRLAFGLALLGGYLIYSGANQLWQTVGSSDTPETITLAELIARGDKGNRYVRITDFHMGKEYAEVGRKNEVVRDGYVPIWPRSAGDSPPAGQGVAIIKTYAMSVNFMNGDTFEGMVVGRELDSLAQETLSKRYSIDFKKIMVIEGKKPAPMRESWGWVGLGIALVLPLVIILAYALWSDRRERQQQASDQVAQ